MVKNNTHLTALTVCFLAEKTNLKKYIMVLLLRDQFTKLSTWKVLKENRYIGGRMWVNNLLWNSSQVP